MGHDDAPAADRRTEKSARPPLSLARMGLGQAGAAEPQCAFRQAVRAYARARTAANASRVAATLRVLREQPRAWRG